MDQEINFKCPHCMSPQTISWGTADGKPLRKCNDCGKHYRAYVSKRKQTIAERKSKLREYVLVSGYSVFTDAQAKVVRLFIGGKKSQAAIAQDLGISRQAVTYSLKEAEANAGLRPPTGIKK